ncbi:MAG TPA: right-handed parallel beta-helix repeat-containing protein [Thermoleophilaceae bacterium]|nr:right-handed parallel beta-helix repeat-containing protein [Thermoleophilaceae bacterium]
MLRLLSAAATAALCLVVAATAFAHVERPAYWPDPAPDKSISPATGGKVPKARSLRSALRKKAPGETRVVCQANSMKLLKKSIRRARKNGYDIRPSDHRKLGRKKAKRLLRLNRRFKKKCEFDEIQPAVTASGNNDRVVVMPGLYLEPTSRSQPTHDPACDEYRTNGDKPGEDGTALSYAYQWHCPNDQNLVAVLGRKIGKNPPPSPPRENRHGIPDEGPCVRCNLQMEGSGVNADDVIIEAGDPTKGDGGPNGVGTKKDVAVRADRADGFVLKNVKVRHAKEHGIYVLESDGYLLTHFKAYYNGLYGTLTFVEDHGVQQHCDALGHGDSGIYPGAAVESGMQRPAGTPFRYNQEIRFCDLHHNMAGYSGTNGNAVYIHHNRIYDNALGLQTDVVTGAGHPGYPGDSMLVEKNLFYSNNFNVYEEDSSVVPAFPFPVGTGLWIAGGNHHEVRDNYFWDNWRRGTMLFSVPDQLICGPAAGGNQQAGCDPDGQTTSYFNSQYDNHMGVRPDGTADPNGTDFWWDPYPGTVGNCWWNNKPAPDTEITTSPGPLPDCQSGNRPDESVGTGNPAQTGELLSCVVAFETRNFDPDGPCPWFKTPPEPQPGEGSAAAGSSSAATGSVFDPLADRVTARVTGPLDRRSDFSGITCADWNASGVEDRAWLVAKIKEFVGGVVVDGEKAVGYGDVLTTEQANGLFNGHCSERYAQGFLLYKLYSYAAVLTG